MIPNRRRLKCLVLICPSGRELLSHRMPGIEQRIFWFVFRSELWEQLGRHSVVRKQPSVGENARQMRVGKYGAPLSTFTICGVKVEADVHYIAVVAQLTTADQDSNQGCWGHTQSATLQSGPLSCDWVPPCAECLFVVILCYSLWISNAIFTCMGLKKTKKKTQFHQGIFQDHRLFSESPLCVYTLPFSVCSHGLKSITSHYF